MNGYFYHLYALILLAFWIQIFFLGIFARVFKIFLLILNFLYKTAANTYNAIAAANNEDTGFSRPQHVRPHCPAVSLLYMYSLSPRQSLSCREPAGLPFSAVLSVCSPSTPTYQPLPYR